MNESTIAFEYFPDQDYLLVKVEGLHEATDNLQIFKDFLEQMKQSGAKRALVDYRQGTYQSTMLMAIDRPKVFEQLHIPRSYTIAGVHTYLTEDLLLLEKLLQNHQYKFKLFTDIEAAKNWLEIPQID
ncbi:MAG: hypothetical protein AAFQ98_01195 [Bacteroidota bacterium]